jgi:hypothetical protein
MTVADIQSQLDEARFIIGQQMARIAELEAEVQNLKAGLSAHEVLQSIYRDSASESARIRAAQAALGVESAPLKSVEPPLDLVAVKSPEPLVDVVTRQRARQDFLCPESIDFKAQSLLPAGNRSGNGSNDQDD